MTTPMRPAKERQDADGVRITRVEHRRKPYWTIGLAIAAPVLLTILAVAIVRWSPTDEPVSLPSPVVAAVIDGNPPDAEPARAAPTPSQSPARVAPRRVVAAPAADPAGLGESPVPEPSRKPHREIDAADAIIMLREEGIHDGIAAFGIPGSDPPKSGILVPEEFELPEGYVRHYQSTDDGEDLPAILMFHPDYEFVDETGKVAKLPEDGVVPADMAPPGLAVDQVLAVPERKRGEPLR